MRPTLKPEGIAERVALWLNLGPAPVAEAMFGMATSRVLMAGARLGLFARLARGPGPASAIAAELGMDPAGLRHLLDCLCSLGYADRLGDSFSLSRRARPWLDPDSPTSVTAFLEFNYDQWDWWSQLEETVRTGHAHEIHNLGADDPRWERYIRAMYQLARLSAPEVAARLKLDSGANRVLDLAGGHGWFAAEICRRRPAIIADVLDLPASARIGREIIHTAGMDSRVKFVEGDLLGDSLDRLAAGEYAAALCFQIVHHFSPAQNVELFRRVRRLLAPGGALAVLDYFPRPGARPDSAAFLSLHFWLTSGAATYSQHDLTAWMRDAGFSAPRRIRLRRVPVQTLYVARVAP